MKYWLLALCVALLSACGGGGGGGGAINITPPVDSDRIAFQNELMAVKSLLATAQIPAATKATYTDQINALEQSSQTSGELIAELRAELERIREEIEDIPPTPTADDCHAMQKILVNDNCESCPTNMQFSVNQCVEIPPAAAACHAQSQILVGDNCESCPTNMQFSLNQCIPTAESCHAQSQILVGDNCQRCPPNMEFNINQCVDIPPTAADCYAEEKVLVADNCQECPPNMQFSENQCVDIPPAAAACYANLQILVDGNCKNCEEDEQFNTATNKCKALPTAAECHADLQILVDGNCENCGAGERFSINECVAIPTADECHAQSQILVGDYCQSCPPGMIYVDSYCLPADSVPSEYRTIEYRSNPGLEDINAIYAYERGYFGQGVTVVNVERSSSTHEDLRANVLTMDINVDYSNIGLTHYENFIHGGAAFDAYYAAHNGGRFFEHYVDFLLSLSLSIEDSSVTHGNGSAGVIAAARNDLGGHGVAPQAKIIPIPLINYFRGSRHFFQDSTRSNTTDLQYIMDNQIPIVNHSIFPDPHFAQSGYVDYELIEDSDSIFVWASGNFGDAHKESDINHITLPIRNPDLEDNWLIVLGYYPYHGPDDTVNITEAQRQVGISCGDVKRWCVAGSFEFSTAPKGLKDDDYKFFSGTSAAAPSVSGALALFKSAAPEMPMTAIRAILLTTATDIGDPGIDNVYGWGLVNISSGIMLIENMKSAGTEELSAVSFANLRGELPSGFAHLHNELSAIKLAIKLTTNLYYNVPLSEMLTPGDAPNMPLGDAAAEMLENRGEETRRGIFAYGDINTELGLRYYGGGKGYSYIAEGTQSATNNFSGNFGGIGGISGKTYGGKFGFTKAIKANMQIFADYERAAIIGKGEEGNIIKGARNARAESWTAGISFTDIWKYGDKIRLSANQEMKLSGGELIIRYPHAVGDFHETFIGEGTQEIEVREALLSLKQKVKMRYTAGYAQKLNKKSEWATAIEYNAGNNAKAISIKWQGEF